MHVGPRCEGADISLVSTAMPTHIYIYKNLVLHLHLHLHIDIDTDLGIALDTVAEALSPKFSSQAWSWSEGQPYAGPCYEWDLEVPVSVPLPSKTLMLSGSSYKALSGIHTQPTKGF